MSSCCVHVQTCSAEKKKPQKEMCLSRTTHGHESKIQTKRMMHAGAAKIKNDVETDSESSKNIDPGGNAPSGVEGRATTEMSTILGGRLCARCRRRIHVAGLLVAVFCALISMLAPQRSLNTTQGISARKKLPDCLLSDLFLPPQ